MSSATEASQASFMSFRPINPLKSIRGHIILILCVALPITVIGAIAGYLYPPVYRAYAIVSISAKPVPNLDVDSPTWQTNTSGFLRSQISMISSYHILQEALTDLKDSSPDSAAVWGNEKQSVFNLQEKLDISQVRGTDLVHVSVENNTPDGLKETVDSLINSYMDRVKKGNFGILDTRRDNLQKRRRELQAKISELLRRKAQIARELGIIAGNRLVTPYSEAVDKISSSIAQAKLERLQAEADIVQLKQKQEKYTDEKLEALARQEIESDPDFLKKKQELDSELAILMGQVSRLKQKERFIENESNNTWREASEDEKDIEARRDKEVFSEELSRLSALKKEYKSMVEDRIEIQKDKILNEFNQEIEAAEEKLNAIAELEKRLQTEFESYRRQQISYTTNVNEAEDIRSEIERARNQISAIDKTLDSFVTEENAPGSISIQQMARYPEKPEHSQRLKLAGAVIGAGWFFALLIPLVIDFLNPWVNGPNDISSILRFPPLGWIIYRSDRLSTDFSLDQLKRLALAIEDRHRNSGLNVMAVTSVKPGGGTTFLCLQLARQFAGQGLKALVLEGNAYRPDTAYTEGESAKSLVDLIDGKATIDEVIRPSVGDLPDRIAVGGGENRHLPAKGRIKQILREICKSYDICLIDCPPVLLSADAEGLARVSDASLMIVEAETIRLGEMRRAAGILDRLDGVPMAVVINQVEVKKSTGYFSDMLEEYDRAEKKLPRGLARLRKKDKRKPEEVG